jgi:hypothetical protein
VTTDVSAQAHPLSTIAPSVPVELSQNREGLDLAFDHSISGSTSADPLVSDVWSVAGWALQFVQLAPRQTLALDQTTGKIYIKVIAGRLTNLDRSPFAAPRHIRGTQVEQVHVDAGDEGALFAVLTASGDAANRIRSMDQLVFTGPRDEVFRWQSFADKFGGFTDIFDGADAHIVPGFHLLDTTGTEIAYVHFWTAGKGVDLSTHNHANDPSPLAPAFAEVHWVFSNGTGGGGMYECEAPGAPTRERYPMQRGEEHGPFFVSDPATGMATLRENGAVEYPWHGWQAGTDGDEGQAFDFVAAFELNPRTV